MRRTTLSTAWAIIALTMTQVAFAQFEPLPLMNNVQSAAYNNSEPFNPPFPPWEHRDYSAPSPGYSPPPIYTVPASPSYGDGGGDYYAPDASSNQIQPGSPFLPIPQDEPGAYLPNQCTPPPPSSGRDGMLQKFAFIDGWLPRIGPHGQENTDLDIYAMLGLPIPSRESPILITPGFQAHFWDNIIDPNLPHNLYDFYLETLWVHKWSDDFETYLGATPGWHGDWENKHEKAWRLEVQAIGNYTYSPTLKFIFGAKYLDRKDVLALPIVGFIWTPNDDIKYEAIFPKPKFAHRICCNGHNEWWWYLAGELGGGIWGIEHSDGTLDVVRSRDYRVFVGVEDRMLGGWTGRLEIGYVFGRKIEFENTGATDKPADTLMLRTGLIY